MAPQDLGDGTDPRVPNFVFLGPDKSGSSWLFERMKKHPQVYAPRAKELFFFDQYYDKGLDWYSGFYRDAEATHDVLVDFSHDYLFSDAAIRRLADALPSAKMMVSLRNPVDRAFSAWLFMRKQGRVSEPFDEAIQSVDELVGHGLYGSHLTRVLEVVDRSRLHVADFAELGTNPQVYLDRILSFLELDALTLSAEEMSPVNIAAEARSDGVAAGIHKIALSVRGLGFPGVVNRIKGSSMVQRGLYRAVSTRREPDPGTREMLMDLFEHDVIQLDVLLDTNFGQRWGYS